MAFDSLTFILLFLPFAVLLYRVGTAASRPQILLALSFVFYLWGSPPGALVLAGSMAVEYALLVRMRTAATGRGKAGYLAASLGFSLGILLYFKYANFLVQEANRALMFLSFEPITWKNTILLLGVSFITFHKISYAIDAYAGSGPLPGGFLAYANYLAFFPKLLQGPITPYRDLAPQLAASRRAALDDVFRGIERFSLGLATKTLLADTLGETADRVFALDPATLTPAHAWLGALSYTFQIYFDFAGYSHMAIGIGRMFGISLPENFNRPYLSANFTEFWRRWHMTLSAWFKEHLYIPLGGNRRSTARTYLNLGTVFLLSGLWHGANWTFVLWGAYHGSLLVLDRTGVRKLTERLPRTVTVPLTFLLLVAGWVLFRSASAGAAFQYLAAMFRADDLFQTSDNVLLAELISNRGVFVLALAGVLSFLPEQWTQAAGRRFLPPAEAAWTVMARACAVGALLVLSFMDIAHTAFVPYIYLRF